jgi:hypothetical protein
MAFQQSSDQPIKHRFQDYGLDRIQVAEWLIRIRDAYNLNYAYTMIHDWIVEENWGPRDDTKFPEVYYTQHESPAFGKHIWWRWRLLKQPPGTTGSLFKYAMDLDFKVLGLKDTEIAWKGQKVKTDRSEFEMQCRGALLIDVSKQWKGWPWSNIKELYTRRTMRQQIARHRRGIYADCYKLRDLVMGYMKLETFMPMKEAGEFFVKRTME